MESTALICPTCASRQVDEYCAECGEHVTLSRDLSLGVFLQDAWEELTSLDSKLFRSFKLLLTKPGELTSEYIAGRRSRYLKPVQLFVLVNVLYFLFVHVIHINTFSTPLKIQYKGQSYSNIIRPLVDQTLAKKRLPFSQVELAYNQLTEDYAKSLVILMVPLFTIILAVVLSMKRRYILEHLVFSIHFYAFFLILCSVGGITVALAALGLQLVTGLQLTSDAFVSSVLGVISAVYLYLALRRVYSVRRITGSLASVLLVAGLATVLFAYRIMLFFATFYSLRL